MLLSLDHRLFDLARKGDCAKIFKFCSSIWPTTDVSVSVGLQVAVDSTINQFLLNCDKNKEATAAFLH